MQIAVFIPLLFAAAAMLAAVPAMTTTPATSVPATPRSLSSQAGDYSGPRPLTIAISTEWNDDEPIMVW